MTEAEFSAQVTTLLRAWGWQTLRVCDKADARRGRHGLWIDGINPPVISTGPDFLILRHGYIPALRTDSEDEIRAMARGDVPFFLELKAPGARKRANEAAQNAWLRVVGGVRC